MIKKVHLQGFQTFWNLLSASCRVRNGFESAGTYFFNLMKKNNILKIIPMCFSTRHLNVDFLLILKSVADFINKASRQYSVKCERRKAHWINFFHLDIITSGTSLVPLAFRNIENSLSWSKQISKILSPWKIVFLDQFCTKRKSNQAILQEITREEK
jgi:hypothetical protein